MLIEKIRDFKRERPFRPFVLVLRNGERVIVTAPEFIAIAPNGTSVMVSGCSKRPFLRISDIVSVRTLQRRTSGRNLSGFGASRSVNAVTCKEVHELYSATPFEPFEMVLPNGTAILVDHPEIMSFRRDRSTVHVQDRDDRMKRVDIKMIVALNEMANGSRPRKRKR